MLVHVRVRLGAIVYLTLLSSCGTQTEPQSDLHYVSWGKGSAQQSTMADATKPNIEICLTGNVGQADYERSKEWSIHTTMAWLRVLKKMDERVTSELTLSCDQPDLTFHLYQGNNRSNAGPSHVNIFMARPYGEWTHELGHAFAALGDTYLGSTAGYCQAGQPQSLMCWGGYGPRNDPTEWSTLWPDDIAGIQDNYKRLHAGTKLVPPPFANQIEAESAFDIHEPWPQPFRKQSIRYVDDEVTVAAGVGPTPIDRQGLVQGL